MYVARMHAGIKSILCRKAATREDHARGRRRRHSLLRENATKGALDARPVFVFMFSAATAISTDYRPGAL